MISGRPIGVDLFAGVGGMTLGFEQAGFDVLAAVEIDPIHCATHEQYCVLENMPELTVGNRPQFLSELIATSGDGGYLAQTRQRNRC